jgi:hypothetical protein
MKKIFLHLFIISLGGIIIFISCKKEKSCEGCKEGNDPPIAVAGPDQVITLPTDSVSLDGTASSDPDGTISEWLWTKISGPASFNINNASAVKTVVKNLIAGTYQFELKVTDNGNLSGKDTIQITVNDLAQPNRPPVANAGADQTITLPTNTVTLDGKGSTDPDNNITTYAWTKISGPSSFIISNANAVQTPVTDLAEGVYQFELKVTDAGGLFSKDTVQVTVNAASVIIACDGSIRSPVNAQLIPVSNLSITRGEVAIASAGNKILFAGGYISSGSYSSSRVDIFDITTNSWTTAELSQPRFNMATAVLGNKIFFAGGDFNNNGAWGTSDIVDIYDAVTNTWTTATLSERRTLMAGAAAGNKVLFVGGTGAGFGSGSESLKVDIYDISNNTWSFDYLPDRSLDASLGIAATVIDNKIYFAGAAGNWFAWDFGGDYSSTINIYDAAASSWSTSSLNEARGAMAAIAIGNKNYWAGGLNVHFGQTTFLPLNLVEIMDMSTGSITFDCLFQPNSGFSAVKKNSKIVFFTTHTTQNGWLVPGIVTDKFDIYDFTTNTWSIGVLHVSIYNASIISVNNTIYVAGGYVNGILSSQVWKLEF